MKYSYLCVLLLPLALNALGADLPAGWVIGWGDNLGGDVTGSAPATFTNRAEIMARMTNSAVRNTVGTVTVSGQMLGNVTALSAGGDYPLAVKANGTLDSWGRPGAEQAKWPANLDEIIAISCGDEHALALKKDGTVVAWGEKRYGATDVPKGLSNVVAIASGNDNSMALKRDGTIVGWGKEMRIPTGLSNVVAIALSDNMYNGGYGLAIHTDGTVSQWSNSNGERHKVPGLNNAVAVSAGSMHSLALRKDGTVFGWGFNEHGELSYPSGLTNVVAIAACDSALPAVGYSLALKADGNLVGWGTMNNKPLQVPPGLSNVVAISASLMYCHVITTNPVVAERFLKR